MNHKFQFGEKVRVYAYVGCHKGIIQSIDGDILHVKLLNNEILICHYKQARKLKPKKKPMEFWISKEMKIVYQTPQNYTGISGTSSVIQHNIVLENKPHDPENYYHVKEVRK